MKANQKKIPISVAKKLATELQEDQVILFTWNRQTGVNQCVTYGKTLLDCEQAAFGGNRIKKFLGWSEELCHSVPKRIRNSVKK